MSKKKKKKNGEIRFSTILPINEDPEIMSLLKDLDEGLSKQGINLKVNVKKPTK